MGKQVWLDNDNDIKEMYQVCHGKNEIIVWCLKGEPKQDESSEVNETLKPPSKWSCLRGKTAGGSSKVSKTEVHSHKMAEVNEIVSATTENHSEWWFRFKVVPLLTFRLISLFWEIRKLLVPRKLMGSFTYQTDFIAIAVHRSVIKIEWFAG